MRSERNSCSLLFVSGLLYICRAELICSCTHHSQHCEITGVDERLKVRNIGRSGYNAGNMVGFKKGNGLLLDRILVCEMSF